MGTVLSSTAEKLRQVFITMAPSTIPTSTSVVESAVIRAPLSHVWHYIKLQDFSKFWSAMNKSEFAKGASEETDIVKWTFKDGTVLEVKQEEHSTINHYITYSVITSQPELSYTSVVSTVPATLSRAVRWRAAPLWSGPVTSR